ncbi:MAG: hypothetical protein ACI9B9_000442 [Halioglobus sp.]|jgi:hypothetical protein
MRDTSYPSWGIEETGDNLDSALLHIMVGL